MTELNPKPVSSFHHIIASSFQPLSLVVEKVAFFFFALNFTFGVTFKTSPAF